MVICPLPKPSNPEEELAASSSTSGASKQKKKLLIPDLTLFATDLDEKDRTGTTSSLTVSKEEQLSVPDKIRRSVENFFTKVKSSIFKTPEEEKELDMKDIPAHKSERKTETDEKLKRKIFMNTGRYVYIKNVRTPKYHPECGKISENEEPSEEKERTKDQCEHHETETGEHSKHHEIETNEHSSDSSRISSFSDSSSSSEETSTSTYKQEDHSNKPNIKKKKKKILHYQDYRRRREKDLAKNDQYSSSDDDEIPQDEPNTSLNQQFPQTFSYSTWQRPHQVSNQDKESP